MIKIIAGSVGEWMRPEEILDSGIAIGSEEKDEG
jgi:hypothetical protein